jgi:hypothetical protein
MSLRARYQGRLRPSAAIGVGALTLAAVVAPLSTIAAAAPAQASPAAQTSRVITSSGLKPGAIKHVWLIILENKSYDATFTGLNQNSYLWKTLPQQGVLLKNYYGTGHSSMDNYLSMVSGQAPEEDTQEDCSVANTLIGPNSDILSAGGSLRANKNFGQLSSPANAAQPSGANAPLGANGCTYPTQVPTLFNQLNAVKASWKGYAQDLGGAQLAGSTKFQSDTVPGREDAICGGPGSAANNPDTNPTNMESNFAPGVASLTGSQPTDQYVAKHFPFAWFESLTGAVQTGGSTLPPLNEPASGTNCDASHIANLDSPTQGLLHDLQSASSTPAFSWITPNNCSDAHDAVCKGNNLSGAFDATGTPDYHSPIPNNPESTTPKNSTGGLYASDLFLKYYIPMIEQSPAFKQGGLIDVTFDEGNPPFTYSGNSFNNANDYQPTAGDKPNASAGIIADAAGENIGGKNVHSEPTGPNSTLGTDALGNQLYPGPGNNSFIDRPPVCTQTSPALVPSDCVPGIVRGGSGSSPGTRTDAVSGGPSSSELLDNSILADDTGRAVAGPGIPASSFVGAVTDTGPDFPNSSAGGVTTGAFQLVGQNGSPVEPTAAVSSITLSAEGDPADLTAGETADPLFDAKDATPGGGDTGSVLISPFIKPGTVSTVFYNHYSWLRTMEDLFDVSSGHDTAALPAGSVSGGLDGQGHIGYAAQPGLRPFGSDVFNNPNGVHFRLDAAITSGGSGGGFAGGPELPAGIAVAALAGAGGVLWLRRRRGAITGE